MASTFQDSAAKSASLDPTSVMAQARQLASVPPDEPLCYTDGLERLSAALDAQARLTDAGRLSARGALVKAVTNQLHVRRLLSANPGIDDIPVRPIFITGLLRTGTTFLQHLLARHDGLRAPALWELMAPAGPGEPTELIAACDAYVQEYHRAAPMFEAIHPLRARLPEECHRLTANTFRDPIYALRYDIPDYTDWLRQQSMVPSYEFHATQLRCILARRPGSPLLLKGPSHLWHLDALGQVYPDAKVIRLHRSPLVALPSVCSLTSVVRGARSADVDKMAIGAYWLDQAGRVLNGLRRGVGPTAVAPLDLRYDDLIADPMGTAERVCDYVGVRMTGLASRRMSAFIAGDEGASTGRHRYTSTEFGLRPDQLAEHFADYMAEFGL